VKSAGNLYLDSMDFAKQCARQLAQKVRSGGHVDSDEFYQAAVVCGTTVQFAERWRVFGRAGRQTSRRVYRLITGRSAR